MRNNYCILFIVVLQILTAHSAIAPDTTVQKQITAEATAVKTTAAPPFLFNVGALKDRKATLNSVLS